MSVSTDVPVVTSSASIPYKKNNPPQSASSLSFFRLFPSLSSLEVWGFGFTGFLLWLGTAPGAHSELGPQAILMWLPLVVVGILINLQVRHMAAHWPEMAGGTPNYTARLLKNHPWLARYVGMAYFQGWASVPTVSAIILADIIMTNLDIAGITGVPPWTLKVALTALAFVVAFAGTRALSILHLFFVVPAFGLLVAFCVQGLGWLAFSANSPGFMPETWGHFDFILWAKWCFVATYAVYAVETSSSFMVDSKRPQNTLLCLSAAALLIPLIFIGGSWVLMRSSGVSGNADNVYLNLLNASLPFWGKSAYFIVISLITAGCLLSCATGCANSPRVLYQMALDGQAAPVFGVASRRNVPGPALVLTLLVSLVFLLWGNVARVLMVTCTGYFFCFIAMHLGLWLNRGKPEVRWPWWSLGFFVVEVIIFVVGGLAWSGVDFLMGLAFPAVLMGLDSLIRRIPRGPLQVAWWIHLYRPRPYVQKIDSLASHVTVTLVLVSVALTLGWGINYLLGNVEIAHLRLNLFGISLQITGFIAIAAACWTTLPQLSSISEAREQAAAEAQHLLRSALDAILVVDERGLIRLANPAAEDIFTLPQERLRGRHLDDLIPGVDAAIAKGEKRSEHRLAQANGSLRIVEVAIADISDGQMNERSIILHDITERKQAEEKLQQFSAHLEHSNRELQDFASVAAHDLQEPLRKITAFGERLQDLCATTMNEQALDYLRRMRNAAERMQSLITDLLTLSRVTTRGQPFVTVHLNQIVKEVLSDLEVAIEKHQAKIELQDLPVISADPMQMRQLLQNLIGNALKFKGEAAPVVKIYATVTPGSSMCQIMVADNGIGFNEKYLDRIFTAFERLHGRDTYEGTGIGLAVCRKIAERHNGGITAKSAPGMGATFIVTLPVLQLKENNNEH
ncbi:MAG: ATP-binding protein [Gallionellaceae bacterium]|nr:ATP-binding protein [Gallionellaceae bacterium]